MVSDLKEAVFPFLCLPIMPFAKSVHLICRLNLFTKIHLSEPLDWRVLQYLLYFWARQCIFKLSSKKALLNIVPPQLKFNPNPTTTPTITFLRVRFCRLFPPRRMHIPLDESRRWTRPWWRGG